MTWNKFVAGLVLAGALGLQRLLNDNYMSSQDWIEFISVLGAAAAVGIIPNTAWLKTAKAWAAGIPVVCGVVAVAVMDGWQFNADFWPILLAAGQVLGVWAVPNTNYAPLAGSPASRIV